MLKDKLKNLNLGLLFNSLLFSVLSVFLPTLSAQAATVHWEYGSVGYKARNRNTGKITTAPDGDYEWHGMFFVDGQPSFCVEPYAPVNTGGQDVRHSGYTSTVAPDVIISYYNGVEQGRVATKTLSLIAYYGYQVNPSPKNHYLTQLLIRDAFGDEYTAILEGDRTNFGINMDSYNAFKRDVMAKVDGFKSVTQFESPNITIRKGETVRVRDTAGILEDLIVDQNTANVDVQIQGNELIITAKENSVTGGVSLKNPEMDKWTGTSFVYKHPNSQGQGTFRLKDPQSGRINITIDEPQQHKIIVNKLDEKTGLPIQGVVFDVKLGGQVVATITTNAQGVAETGLLDAGSYVVVEKSVPANYRLNPQEHPVEIVAGQGDKNVRVTNLQKEIFISIQKKFDEALNSTDTNVNAEGVTFTVTSDTTGATVATLVTNADGFAKSEGLPINDTYTVTETAPAGYAPAEPIKVVPTDEDNKVYHYELTNTVLRSKLNIVKTNAETGETIAVAGVTFELLNANQEVLEIGGQTQFVTDETGSVELPETLKYGNYFVREVQAPEGYLLAAEPLPVTVDGKETTLTVTFENVPQKGVIEVLKTGDVILSWEQNADGVFVPTIGEGTVPGATFAITSVETGEEVARVTTVEGGAVQSPELALGDYDVTEVEAPAGFIINSTPTRVSLTPQEQTVRLDVQAISVRNERKTLAAAVSKVFEQSNIFENDQVATIGLFTREDYTENGVTLPANSLVAKLTIDGNGILQFEDIPSEMKVYAKEISSSDAYTVNETEFEVTLTEKDAARDTVVTIENTLKRGDLKILKTDSDSKGLEGVEFVLVAVTENGEEVEFGTYTTDVNGEITVTNLETGNWYFKEVNPLKGYILDPTKYNFTINGGETAEGNTKAIVNERIPEITTDATNAEDNTKTVLVHGKIKEVAHLTNLDKGKTYIVKASLNTLEDKKEKIVVLEKTVVATGTEMDVEFIFDVTQELASKHTVFGEEVYDEKGNLLSSHFDWEDKRQTVYVHNPRISTLAKAGGKKHVYTVDGLVEITDELGYTDAKDQEYIVVSWLVKYGTNEIVTVDGKEVKVETLVRLNGDGTEVVSLGEVDLSKLGDGKYTAMEQVFTVVNGPNGEKTKGNLVTEHVDPNDEDQSFVVSTPKIGTTATVAGKKAILAGINGDVKDTIAYEGYRKEKVVIRTWAVKHGTDEKVSAVVEQVVELDGNGEITIDAAHIETANLAIGKYTLMEQVFEAVEDENGKIVAGKLIAEHVDPNDESQTFTVEPHGIGTTAKVNGGKSIQEGLKGKVTDTLKHHGYSHARVLIRTWAVKHGTNVKVSEELDQVVTVDGDGEITIEVSNLDTSKLAVGDYTLMEQVYSVKLDENGKEVADKLISEHVDPNDKSQTFSITRRPMPNTGTGANGNLFLIVASALAFIGLAGVLVVNKRKQEKE